jgi:predicted ATP-grasp superfamily ATP-dependent carboligase
MTTKARNVLVTDGEHRAALAVVRSLGHAGHSVYVASPSARSLAGASRYVRGRDMVTDPLAAPDRFADDVCRVIRARGIEIVIPITDPALLALVSRRHDLGDAVLPWPDAERVRQVADKALVIDVARELGVRVPEQRYAENPDEAIDAERHLRFPVVLKPSRSVRESVDGAVARLEVTHASDATVVRARVAELEAAAFPLLVQERIVGPGIGVSCLMWNGRLVAHFTHRRLRERPPAGGVSVYAESIEPLEGLVEQSATLLRRLDWQGVAMVEYKIDAATGEAYLMEVNGRFWGSLQLAIDAGVDFPALLVAASAGEIGTRDAPSYRAGVRFRWWWGDVDHLLVRLMRSPARLALPPGAPSRFTVVREFIAAGLPQRDSDSLRRDDPRPFLVDTLDWLGGRFNAAKRAVASPSRQAPPADARASAAASTAA